MRAPRQVFASLLAASLLYVLSAPVAGQEPARPSIEITAPAAGAVVSDDTPEIKLAFHAAGAIRIDGGKLEVKLDGALLPCRTGRDLARCQAPFLFPGEHQILATAPDSAGGRVVVELSFTLPASLADREKPTLHLDFPNSLKIYTAEPIELFIGYDDVGPSGLDLASFALAYDGRPLADACRAQDSRAICVIPPDPGLHVALAKIADRAGNLGETTLELEILPRAADLVPPEISILGPEAQNLDGHVFPTSQIAAIIEFSDEGSGLDRDTLSEVQLDGNDFGGCDNGFGMPSTECSASLAAGVHRFRVTAADLAGNRSEAFASFVVASDRVEESAEEPEDPPEIEVYRPDPFVELSANGVDFLVIWSHWKYPIDIDTAAVWVKLDGREWPGDGLYDSERLEDSLPLPVGPHRLSIHVANHQGRSSQLEYDFEVYDTRIDRTPPRIGIEKPAEGQELIERDHDFDFVLSEEDRGSGIDPTSFRVEIDGIDFSIYCDTMGDGGRCRDVELPDGRHRLKVRVADKRGNLASATRHFSTLKERRDTWGPDLSFAEPAEEPMRGSTSPPVRVTYSDRSGVDLASFRLKLDGKRLASPCVLGKDEARCSLPPLPFGKHVLEAEVRDPLGNAGKAKLRLHLAPVVLPEPESDFCIPGSGRGRPAELVWMLRPEPPYGCFCPPALDCCA